MHKKGRDVIGGLVGVLFLVLCYFLFFNGPLENLHVYIKLGVTIFGTVIIRALTSRMLPAKKKTSKKTSSSNTTKQTSTTPPKKKLSQQELLTADIDTMYGDDFERLVAWYFEDKGYNPEIMGGSGDHGVDIVMTDPKDGLKIAVQCKRYKNGNNISNSELIKLEGGKRFYKCPGTWFITTSDYTHKAKEYAEQTNMRYWNGLIVHENIGKWRKKKLKKSS